MSEGAAGLDIQQHPLEADVSYLERARRRNPGRSTFERSGSLPLWLGRCWQSWQVTLMRQRALPRHEASLQAHATEIVLTAVLPDRRSISVSNDTF